MRKLLALVILFTSGLAYGACTGSNPTWTSTPDQASVASCISSAGSGSTINVSAGSATWTTGITITGKALNLIGAGTCTGGPPVTSCTNATSITYTGSGDVFQSNVSTTHFVRISGFTWTVNASNSEMWSVDGENSAAWFQTGFRIDHNRFVIGGTIPHIGNPTATFGLIDNNIFEVAGGAQAISPIGTPDGSDGGFTAWMQTGLNMGGNNAVFIEDNSFNYSTAAASSDDAIDCYGGCRTVIRHNQFTNTHVGFHGYDSGNRRSPAWIEVYQNQFVNNSPTKYRFGTWRGGTGVFWGNSSGGTQTNWDGVTLMVYRASPATGAPGGWGNCNGNKYVLGSANFSDNGSRSVIANTGTFNSTHVGKCSLKQDNVCTGDASCTAISGGVCQPWSDGDGNAGYPCRDQVGTGQGQVRDPLYFWSNTGPGANIGSYDGGGTANGGGIQNYLLAGRDYIDNGTTAKPGYAPFTYPHPLQGSSLPVVSAPVFNPVAGSYTTGQSVAITSTTSGATICYTTDGSTPTTNGSGTCTHGTTYSTAVTISSTSTLQAIGTMASSTDSNVVIGNYIIGALATYYVDNSGTPPCSDTSGQSGDESHPFCTIDYALTRMAGGNTLYIKNGTYDNGSDKTGPSGSAGAATVISAFPGHSPVITSGSINSGHFGFTGVHYMNIFGLRLTTISQGFIISGSDHMLLQGNTVDHTGGLAYQAHLSSSFINFAQNVAHDSGQNLATDGEGFYVGKDDSLPLDNSHDITISNNTIGPNIASECIEFKIGTHDNIADGNIISGCNSNDNGFGGAGIEVNQSTGAVQSWPSNPNHIIRNNIIHDVGPGTGSTLINSGIRVGTGALVYNNIIYNINSIGNGIFTDNQSADSYVRRVYENTVDVVAARSVVNSGGTVDFKSNIGPNTTNNIVPSDSYFVNRASHNYVLTGPLPVTTDVSSFVPVDIVGLSRTAYPPTDMGAYEFQGIPGATLSLSHTTFANQTIGTCSVGQTVQVANNGTGTLTFNSITLGDPTNYQSSSTCGSTLNISTTCSVTVQFCPASSGLKTSSVTFSNNAIDTPQVFDFLGTGIVNPTPGISTSIQGAVTVKGGITIK